LAAAALAFMAALTVFYAHIGRVEQLDSDQAAVVLEAQDMLHGNLILHGWYAQADIFLTTDIPFYAAGVAAFGVSPRGFRYVAALIYTLAIAASVLLARARGSEPRGWLRMLVAFAFLAVPASGLEAHSVLRGPYHVTTTLYVLIAVLLLEWLRSWRAAAGGFVLLTLAQIGDPLALVIGVLPFALVMAMRLIRSGLNRADLLFLGSALASVGAARLALRLIRLGHGITTIPLDANFVRFDDLPHHFMLVVRLCLEVFGANYFGLALSRAAALPSLRAVALAFVIATAWALLQRQRAGGASDRTSELLLWGLLAQLAALLFSAQANDGGAIRYMSPILFFGAALAGREGTRRFLKTSLLQAGAVAVALLLLTAAWPAYRAAPAPVRPAKLAPWLKAHGLHEGLGGYWEANAVTLEARDSVQVRGVTRVGRRLAPYRWGTKEQWYDPVRHDARFVVIDPREPSALPKAAVEDAFGVPLESAEVDGYLVLIYDRNLLLDPGWRP